MSILKRRTIFRGGNTRLLGADPSIIDGPDPTAPDPSFGLVWAIEEQTDYYGVNSFEVVAPVGPADIVGMTVTANIGIKRITPGGGGTPVWTSLNASNMQASGLTRRFAEQLNDAAHVICAYRWLSANYEVAKIALSDGAEQWAVAMANGCHTVVKMSTDRAFGVVLGANGLRSFDASSVGAPSVTNYTLNGEAGATRSACITGGDHSLVTTNSSEELRWYFIASDPGSGSWTADVVLDVTTELSTPHASWTAEVWVSPDPLGTAGEVWLGASAHSTIYRLNPSKVELAKIDLNNLPGITAATCRGLWTDPFGDVYIMVDAATPNELHVARYSRDGVLKTWTGAQSLTMTDSAQPQDICVHPITGDIWITNNVTGEVCRISQS